MYSTDAIRPDPRAVLQGDTWRITVLTPRLVRLEYSPTGQFTDSATQLAADRHFPPAPFRVSESGGSLQLTTEFLRLTYDKGPFSSTGLTIQITGKDSLYASVWHYGDEPHDLGGTARTLDEADGAIPLEHGILSEDGWSVLRDTGSGVTGLFWIESDTHTWKNGQYYCKVKLNFRNLADDTISGSELK